VQPTDGGNRRWDDVKIFLALFRGGTLAAAAARLDLDASTASRRLTAFERELGVRLFDRTPDGLLPTAAGERLLPAAEEAERGIVALATAATGLEVAIEGVVRITAPPGLADLFVAPILDELRTEHAGLVFELDASQRVMDLSRRDADIALRTIKPTTGDLVMTRLGTSRYVPLCAPKTAKQIARLRRISDVRWIDWPAELAQIPPARWLARHVGKAPRILRTSSLGAHLSAAASGLGVALLPSVLEGREGLVRLPLHKALHAAEADLPVEDVWLVGHRALREVPRIAAVWAFLLRKAERFSP
jgi:DNA-binding transcriptional LysR family regulator